MPVQFIILIICALLFTSHTQPPSRISTPPNVSPRAEHAATAMFFSSSVADTASSCRRLLHWRGNHFYSHGAPPRLPCRRQLNSYIVPCRVLYKFLQNKRFFGYMADNLLLTFTEPYLLPERAETLFEHERQS
mgnify:CR=1 FL=1